MIGNAKDYWQGAIGKRILWHVYVAIISVGYIILAKMNFLCAYISYSGIKICPKFWWLVKFHKNFKWQNWIWDIPKECIPWTFLVFPSVAEMSVVKKVTNQRCPVFSFPSLWPKNSRIRKQALRLNNREDESV